MSRTREEYDRAWANFKSGPPRVDPRESHHLACQHSPSFDLLCDRAAIKRVTVQLGVTKHLIVETKGKEQRDLREIRLVSGERELASEPIRNGDIEEAARNLLPVLAR